MLLQVETARGWRFAEVMARETPLDLDLDLDLGYGQRDTS